MSFYTGCGTELLYASNSAAAALGFGSSGAEAQVNTTAAFGVQAHLPADFWLPNPNQIGRTIRIVARGVWASAGATFTVSIRGGAVGTGGPILLGVPVFTAASGGGAWYLCGDVTLTAIGAAGAHSSILGRGTMFSLASFAANTICSGVFGGGATPGTLATLDTSIANHINFNCACGTVSASNIWTLNQLLVYGLN